eukprot:Nk52_evm2s478 gene=Nk52_evmTU2s478
MTIKSPSMGSLTKVGVEQQGEIKKLDRRRNSKSSPKLIGAEGVPGSKVSVMGSKADVKGSKTDLLKKAGLNKSKKKLGAAVRSGLIRKPKQSEADIAKQEEEERKKREEEEEEEARKKEEEFFQTPEPYPVGEKHQMATLPAETELPCYRGATKGQLRHGQGVYFYANKFYQYEGEWVDGHKHGTGILRMRDGSFYEGTFEHGEMTGHGYRRYITGDSYSGEFLNGLRHGMGTFVSVSRRIQYEGEWKKGKREGKGVLRLKDHSLYDGEFRENMRHGKGQLMYGDQNEYDGGWVSDLFGGKGAFTFKDFTCYDGQWVQGRFHGFGRFLHGTNLIEYIGNWENGIPENRPLRLQAQIDKVETKQGETLHLNVHLVNEDGEMVSEESGRTIHVYLGCLICKKPKKETEGTAPAPAAAPPTKGGKGASKLGGTQKKQERGGGSASGGANAASPGKSPAGSRKSSLAGTTRSASPDNKRKGSIGKRVSSSNMLGSKSVLNKSVPVIEEAPTGDYLMEPKVKEVLKPYNATPTYFGAYANATSFVQAVQVKLEQGVGRVEIFIPTGCKSGKFMAIFYDPYDGVYTQNDIAKGQVFGATPPGKGTFCAELLNKEVDKLDCATVTLWIDYTEIDEKSEKQEGEEGKEENDTAAEADQQ